MFSWQCTGLKAMCPLLGGEGERRGLQHPQSTLWARELPLINSMLPWTQHAPRGRAYKGKPWETALQPSPFSSVPASGKPALARSQAFKSPFMMLQPFNLAQRARSSLQRFPPGDCSRSEVA